MIIVENMTVESLGFFCVCKEKFRSLPKFISSTFGSGLTNIKNYKDVFSSFGVIEAQTNSKKTINITSLAEVMICTDF